LIPFIEQFRVRIAQEHLNVFRSRRSVSDESLECRPKRLVSEVVFGILLGRTIESVEKRSDIENLRSILHKVFLDYLPLC